MSRDNEHEDKHEPGLGDLSSVLQQDDKTMGKIDQLSDDELIGDLSVLDDTLAELDSEIKESAALEDEDFALLDQDADEDDIPLLSESAIVVDGHPSNPVAEDDVSFSVSQIEQLTEDKSALSEPEDTPVLTEIDQEDLERELPMETVTGEQISPDDSVFATSLFEENAEADATDEDPGAVFSDMDPMDSVVETADEDLHEAVAQASPQASATERPAAASTPSAGVLGGDLHSILSSKLDAIVSETLSAIGNELHQRLSGQIEEMILNSVDRALPPLMQKFSDGLRGEIESQVREQLPNIVNNLMGSMKISD